MCGDRPDPHDVDMNTDVTPPPTRRSASPAQLEWLGRELVHLAGRGPPPRRPGRRDPPSLPRHPALLPLPTAARPGRRLRRSRPDLAGRRQPRPAAAAPPIPHRLRDLAVPARRRRGSSLPTTVAALPGDRGGPAAGRPRLRGRGVPGRTVAAGAGLRTSPGGALGRRCSRPRLRGARVRSAAGRHPDPDHVVRVAGRVGRPPRRSPPSWRSPSLRWLPSRWGLCTSAACAGSARSGAK